MGKMKVLVIGSGGREHTMARKIAQSPLVQELYCAPGNAGTSDFAKNVAIKPEDIDPLLQFARAHQIDLTVVGPELPLAKGIVDAFEAGQMRIIGPCKAAAQLEGSKIFAKHLMRRNGIPTTPFTEFPDVLKADAFLMKGVLPTVIKVDGLAAGKGVMVCETREAIMIALQRIRNREFGDAGNRFFEEGFLLGEEASFICLVDGKGHVLPMASSQDHKRVFDNDKGDNTGGMGAYSPAPIITPEREKVIISKIIRPTIEALKRMGIVFKGVLYAGLMIMPDGRIYVLEFNVRFGDPEIQPILARMRTDIMEVFLALTEDRLDEIQIDWDPRPAVCVVMASKGYPGSYKKGFPILGLNAAAKSGIIIDHAGTDIGKGRDPESGNGQVVTSGGRVLGVTALGDDYQDAIRRAYSGVNTISWGDCDNPPHFRTDIAQRALK